MIKNYLLTAIRNLWRSKGFSLLNLTGLAVGMASATLILLVIHNESTYDSFHKNKATLYKVWNRDIVSGELSCYDGTPMPLGPALVQEYSGIANAARVDDRWAVTDVGEKKMSSHMNVVDPSFLTMFSFPMLRGNPATALQDPSSMVVTEAMAKKLFGDEPALNRNVTINHRRYTITAILKDLPTNSTLNFEFLINWNFEKTNNHDENNWGNNSYNTYVQLQPNAREADIDLQIKKTTIRHTKNTETTEIFLHPLSLWHLYSNFENGKPTGGAITVVRLLSIIAAFILLIACINFMNLSTARSERRAKEVGIRKVAGAYRSMLIGQFLGESLLMAILSGLLALALVQLTLPWFDILIGQALKVPYSNPWFWTSALIFIIGTGILAGSYPAFFLSAFKPVSVLKGSFKKSHAAINPRKVLVVLQFSFAILLIICTIIVVKQTRYAQDRIAGYDHGRIIYHWTTGDLNKNFDALRHDLLDAGIVTDVSRSNSPLTQIVSTTWSMQWAGKHADDKTDIDQLSEDQGLVRTAGLQLIQGRDINPNSYPTDSSAMLLNEAAVKVMGFKDPIGQTVTNPPDAYHVIGVVKDFISGSPYQTVRPMAIFGSKNTSFNVINMRLADGKSITSTIDQLRKIFIHYNPDYPFEYHFAREDYAQKFKETQQIATLSGLFAGLTIFISCLGLFGLAAYMAEARIKEIGVRKVLGASTISITTLLTKEFLTLVMLALLIAAPIAWFIMHSWLQGYAYHISIDAWVFLLAATLSMFISVLTVGGQAIAAARSNPAKSLRPN